MADPKKKSLMRSLGEFVGHVVRAVKTDPAAGRGETTEVRRTVEEDERDGVILRRTTIEEVEVKRPPADEGPRES